MISSAACLIYTLVAMAIAATAKSIQAYQEGKQKAREAISMAQEQAKQMREKADEQQREQSSKMMEALTHKRKASENLRQGEIEQQKANIEQTKGEREAHKRSIILAQEIGNQYANYSANGLLVDSASKSDTFSSILNMTTREGASDVSSIMEEANMNKWALEERKRSLRVGAESALADANTSSMQAEQLSLDAYQNRQNAVTTLQNGYRAARNYRKQGIRGVIEAQLTGGMYASSKVFAYSLNQNNASSNKPAMTQSEAMTMGDYSSAGATRYSNYA